MPLCISGMAKMIDIQHNVISPQFSKLISLNLGIVICLRKATGSKPVKEAPNLR